MKVLKFGGTSVGSAGSIKHVEQIAGSVEGPVVVVVSALGGITDELIKASQKAKAGDASYLETIASIRSRHEAMCDETIADYAVRETLKTGIHALLDELEGICRGISLLKVLPRETASQVQSFGERMSAMITSALIEGSTLCNALELIFTKDGAVDFARSEAAIRAALEGRKGISIVPGFIATDENGAITTLGRGGSDYTASIIASSLDAEVLEIWTDVDGFMTADPRIISTSYVIDELSYEEAMELCNFGAKVIYPPTLYPVCRKGIPILVKNTFNPSAKGTLIHGGASAHASERVIKGISSVDNISLITLSGTSMVGIVGVDSRIFTALASRDISVFLASQSASETGISIGVGAENAAIACQVLSEAFAQEIASGAINPVKREDELAAVAIVGENMKHNCGIAGKLFSTLGRNGISIIALAQGASESNISFVIKRKYLRKSLNVIHDSFLLSEFKELNVVICGVGTVGGQLIGQIAMQREKLMKERNLKINIVGIARSTKGVFDREGISLRNWKEALEAGTPLNPQELRDRVIGMNIFNSVFVDCTANAEIAALYGDFFDHGISVVAANKIAASSDYSEYRKLKEKALRRGVKFLFETNVGAGLPIINTINDLRNSGDRIEKIEAVLSGTLNFIFNSLSADVPFSETVRLARENGFSEPDPRIDLSGKDVIRKLVILAREAGYEVEQKDVDAELFIPSELFECSEEEFWRRLPGLDAGFEEKRRELEKEHKRWRFVAKMENGRFSVSLRTFDEGHSFYVLDGSNNIVLLTTERYHQHPMLIQGYGAGAGVTAAGVFADIMRIANI
ncbi:MAG: bifunctional aspartate kinase/homoserine dehydrogenase I [Bacteroidales bacterium]|nr:bifunctional aspartate kinase/homoserine dehydrogenase I [Bacteroidales bacterium]